MRPPPWHVLFLCTTARWGVPDPVTAGGSGAARRRAFESAWALLRRHIDPLLALPRDQIDRTAMQGALRAIGRSDTIDGR